jgi:molybdopterin-guanine dinucleotide biosynthesis protein A
MLVTEKRMPPKDKDNSKRLVVYVSEALYEELEALAGQEDRSVSNFTRNLILEAVQQIKDSKKSVS